jgi:DNA-directed RNA polymerase subunit B
MYRTAIMQIVCPTPEHTSSSYVFLNGEIVGYTNNAMDTVQQIRSIPLPAVFVIHENSCPIPGPAPYCASSVYSTVTDATVYVHTEDGRVVRPLLTVPQCAVLTQEANVDALLQSKVLRFVDAAEITTLDVALFPATLHTRPDVDLLEVHAHLILGVTAALIPLLQANQSPRNAYQTSMGPREDPATDALAQPTTGGGWNNATRTV